MSGEFSSQTVQMLFVVYLFPKKFIISGYDIFSPADTLVRKDRFVQVMDGEGGVPLGKNHPPTMEQKHEVFVLFQT